MINIWGIERDSLFGYGYCLVRIWRFHGREVAVPMLEPVYRRRHPQDSPYYRCVEDHFERFEMIYEDRFERRYGFFRPYVKRVIYRYLDCGI
ncbi:MAG: hypothetical protein ACE5DO_12200, partial [Desulfobacterales bacterium]